MAKLPLTLSYSVHIPIPPPSNSRISNQSHSIESTPSNQPNPSFLPHCRTLHPPTKASRLLTKPCLHSTVAHEPPRRNYIPDVDDCSRCMHVVRNTRFCDVRTVGETPGWGVGGDAWQGGGRGLGALEGEDGWARRRPGGGWNGMGLD